MAEARELIAVLNEAISMEYGALFLLSQHLARVHDQEIRRMLKAVEEMELEHAEKTARLVLSLGGVPNADFPSLSPRTSVREILQVHIDGEKQAIDLYARAARAASTAAARELLDELRGEEEQHLAMFTDALARLS